MWQRWFQRLQPLFLCLALLFIGFLLRSQWPTLRAYEWRLDMGWLGLAVGFTLASWALEIQVWRLLLGVLGGSLPYGPAVRIWFFAAVIRYIPGNIWQPLSMALQCQAWGIRPEVTLASIAFYQALILLAVTPIAALYFSLTGNWGLLTTYLQGAAPWLVGLSIVPVIIFLARPSWLLSLLNWALVKVGRAPIAAHLSSGRLLWLLLIAVLNWLLWGASFGALTLGLGQPAQLTLAQALFHLIAVFPIAYIIGFLSLITPSGIGVREGAFYLLLVPLFDPGLVTVAALVMRIWSMIGELLMALLSSLTARWQPPPSTLFASDTPVELASEISGDAAR